MLAAMVVTGAAGLGLRARDRAAGLRPAPAADPGHDGRPDRRRAAARRDLGAGPDRRSPLPTALRGAFLLGDVAIEKYPAARGRRRARRVRRHAAGAQPHAHRPPDPRRRRERRDGGGAGLPHPPPVRRRVRGGLGAGRAGRRDVGPLPARRSRPRWAARSSCWCSSSSSSAAWARWAAASSARCWSALVANYTGFLAPKVALVSNILLMVVDPAVAAAGALSRGQALSVAMIARPALRRPAAQPRARRAAGRDPAGAGARAVPVPAARRPLNTAAKICVFIVLVASYDLLLGLHRHRLLRPHHVLRHRRLRRGHRARRAWAPTWGARGRASPLALAVGIAAGAADRPVLAARARASSSP